MWCNIGYAALISYYNLKLQDNITDHFTPEQINQFYMNDVRYVTNYKGEKLLGRDLKYSMISIKEEDKKIFIEDFPSIIIQIYYENKTDKIVSISQSRIQGVFCVIFGLSPLVSGVAPSGHSTQLPFNTC